MSEHDDFAASIGATRASGSEHDAFAASIGATRAKPAPPEDPEGDAAATKFATEQYERKHSLGGQLSDFAGAVGAGFRNLAPAGGLVDRAQVATQPGEMQKNLKNLHDDRNLAGSKSVLGSTIGGAAALGANLLVPEALLAQSALGAVEGGTAGDKPWDWEGAAIGAATPGIVHGVATVAKPIVKGIAEKAGQAYGYLSSNIDKNLIGKYRGRRDAINAIDTKDAADTLGRGYNEVRDTALGKKAALDNEVDQVQQGFRSDIQEKNAKFNSSEMEKRLESQRDHDARLQLAREGEQQGLGAAKEKRANLQGQASTQADAIHQQTARDFADSIPKASDEVSASSGRAFDHLHQSNVTVPKRYLLKEFDTRLSALNGPGGQPPPSAAEEVNLLQKYRDYVNQNPNKVVTGAEMKSYQQALNRETENLWNARRAGSYSSPAEKSLMSLGSDMGKSIKFRDPEYGRLMKETADKTSSLNAIRDRFTADPDSAYRGLKDLTAPQNAQRLQEIQSYERNFGGDYSSRMKEAERLRGQDFDQMVQPDIEAAREGRRNVESAIDIEKRGNQRSSLARSQKVGARNNEARVDSNNAKNFFADQYQDIDNQLSSVRGRTPSTAVNDLRKLGRRPEAAGALSQQMEQVARSQGKDPNFYGQMADDLAVKDRFRGAVTHGSRNVNLMSHGLAGLGKALGNKLGQSGEGFGRFAGSIIGGVSDLAGPQLTKKIFDTIDGPIGQRIGGAFDAAAKQGPKAVLLLHNRLMKTDPEYRSQFEEGTP